MTVDRWLVFFVGGILSAVVVRGHFIKSNGGAETGRSMLDFGWTHKFLEPLWNLMGTRANDPWRYVMPMKRSGRNERSNAVTFIPEEFDSRLAWPYCPTIGEIFEQGKCASCWAVAPTDVMSDRICIRSGGRQVVRLSAGHLLSCCGRICGKGCRGGFPGGAWMYWKRKGIVTGAGYNSNYGCQRYPFFSCSNQPEGNVGSARDKCPRAETTRLHCQHTCQSSYNRDYKDDLYFGESVYRIPKDVRSIQLEILENGPVQANLRVYEDFLNHRTGVYRHLEGRALEYHAVKIIGWGVDKESGLPYWTAANPWSKRWGDRGFFKILRGSNHAEIESHVMAGIPRLAPQDVVPPVLLVSNFTKTEEMYNFV